MKLKLTNFEKEEIKHRIEVLIDTGEEIWQSCNMTELELENLCDKIKPLVEIDFSKKEFDIIKEESEDLLSVAETNYGAGFPEYKNDVVKLKKLVSKLETVR